MAVLLLKLLISLAMMFGCSSGAVWCICRSDMSDSVLQETLDRACRAGADCSSRTRNGVCFYPNTVRAHCSYAVNSYFQRQDRAQGSCDFNGTVVAIATDPSPSSSCIVPSSKAAAVMPLPPSRSKSPPTTTTPVSIYSPRTSSQISGTDISDEILEKTPRSACRAGADCKLIKNNGVCYTPNTLKAHCTYAVSRYYQRKARAQGTCDSAGTATLVTSYN